MAAEHPNKHIRAALRYAEQHGWRVVKAGPRAHVWGKMYNISVEPSESDDLAGSRPELVNRLLARLDEAAAADRDSVVK